MQKTQLDVLNELLKDPKLGLPQFRQTVSGAGSNLPWLKKILPKNPNASPELIRLVNMTIHQLVKEEVRHAA